MKKFYQVEIYLSNGEEIIVRHAELDSCLGYVDSYNLGFSSGVPYIKRVEIKEEV